MKIIRNKQLHSYCRATLRSILAVYGKGDLYYVFLVMYLSGARFSDAVRFLDWERTKKNYVYTGQKNNRVVMVPIRMMGYELLKLHKIYNNKNSFSISYQVALRVQQANGRNLAVGGRKKLALHVYRHHKAKYLYGMRYKIEQIQIIIGDAGKTVMDAYINSVICEL